MTHLRAVAACLLVVLPGTLAAQDAPESQDGFSGSLRVGGLYVDNFFQIPEGAEREGVLGLATELRLAVRPERGGRHVLYLNADRVGYEDFGSAGGVRVGVEREGRPHTFDFSVGFDWDRPTFDVGDRLEKADSFRADGWYEYRIDQEWQAGAAAYWQTEDYDAAPANDNDLLGGALVLRYRGFGDFQPELGLGAARRDVLDDREDHTRRELWVRVRTSLSPRTHVVFRYRFQKRVYDVETPGHPNFGRDDDRHQLAVQAGRRLTRRLTAHLHYVFETSNSTRPDRDFDTQSLLLGLTVGL